VAAARAAVLLQAAHPRAASRRVGFAPVPGVLWPAEAVRMRAVWRPAGSVRRAAGHPSEGDFAPLQSTIRPARPLSTQSRTAAVVVSPIHPQCASRAPAFTGKSRATLSPFSDKSGSLQSVAGVPAGGVPTAGTPDRPIVSAPHLNRVRKPCRTISYTICVVTVSRERVKRAALGAYGRLVYWRGRLRTHGAPNRGRGASTHPGPHPHPDARTHPWGGVGSSISGM
jgi:hypothetical protein